VRRHRPLVGLLDETAHLALGLLIARRRPAGETAGVLAGSMVLDLDHAPSELGHEWLRSGGRGRPYPHTAFAALAPAALARRAFWRGAAIGLAAHLARDLTDPTTGVRLLWPLWRRELRVPRALYPLAVGALAVRGAQRA
jgi:membrane-bound metal-dependent hydrolase YbcI (DUF457 family)